MKAGRPKGRVRIEHNTVVSDLGTPLRGGAVRIFAYGAKSGVSAAAINPAYYRALRECGLNAVRICFFDAWQRSHGYPHWNLAAAEDRDALLAELDLAVHLASSEGLYSLIDYHDEGGFDRAHLREFWELVAPRYAQRTEVFYELANEPAVWYPETYTDEVLRELEAAYRRIREMAPQTHVVMLSFARLSRHAHSLPGHSVRDVTSRLQGIDWTNASVGFHCYAAMFSEPVADLKAAFPCVCTEADMPAHAGGDPEHFNAMDGREYLQEPLERLGVSWFCWNMHSLPALKNNFRRGVLRDAAAKGYLWKAERPSAIAIFLFETPWPELLKAMKWRWRHLGALLFLGGASAICGGAMVGMLAAGAGNPPAWWGAAALVTGAARMACLGFQHRLMGYLYGRYSIRLANGVFRRCLTFGKIFFDRNRPEVLAERIGYRHELLGLFRGFIQVVSEALFVLACLVVLMILSWRLALVLLAALAARWAWSSAAGPAGPAAGIEPETLEALRTLELDRARGRQEDAARAYAATLEHKPLPRHSFAAFGGGRAVLPRLGLFREVQREFARCLPRVNQFLDLLAPNGKYAIPSGDGELNGIVDSIRFQSLTFAYPDGEPVLHDVSFIMRRGKVTAVVGPAGAGKSTLAQLLLRAYDVSRDAVVFDGVCIRTLSTDAIRRNVCLWRQDEEDLSSSTEWRGAEPILIVDAVGNAAQAQQVVARMRDTSVTIVLLAEQLEAVAAAADWVVMLDRGRITAQGPPGALSPVPVVA